MLPGKAFGIAISLGNDRDENEALQFPFETLVHVVGFKEAVAGVGVKVDGDVFFESGFEFYFQGIDKLRYPVIAFIVFLTIPDEHIILEAGED